MATSTTKLGLTKPDFVDVVDISELNDNANLIDAAVGMAIVTSATRPATPWAGQIIFETDTLVPYVWDGSAWQVAGGGGGSIEISATAPVSPSAGDLWWDSDDGKMFIYYDDGTTSQWVDAAGPSVAVQDTAPTGYEGQLWLDSTDGSMYVYYTDPGGGASSWIGAVSRSGGILQVVSATKTDTFTTTSTSFTDITGLSVSITPRSTSSKIFVSYSIQGSGDVGVANGGFQLVRNSTAIAIGDAAGSRARVSSTMLAPTASDQILTSAVEHLDSPSTTSTVTYKVQGRVLAAGTLNINAADTDSDATIRPRAVSTITAIEVAG